MPTAKNCRCTSKTCLHCERTGARGFEAIGDPLGPHMHRDASIADCTARVSAHERHARRLAGCPMCRTADWIDARNIRLAQHQADHARSVAGCEFCRIDARVSELRAARGH